MLSSLGIYFTHGVHIADDSSLVIATCRNCFSLNSIPCWLHSRSGGHLANFLHSIIFPIFQNDQNAGYLFNITLIFDRCY